MIESACIVDKVHPHNKRPSNLNITIGSKTAYIILFMYVQCMDTDEDSVRKTPCSLSSLFRFENVILHR